jgi:broad specificity phosphatase PhoE
MILFVRHAESEKNTKGKISSAISAEALTTHGVKQATELATHINNFVGENGLCTKKIYAAYSARALATAETIARNMATPPEIVSIPEFKSFSVGLHAGQSEKTIQKIDAPFIRDLNLYRKGVVNSYDIIYGGSEATLKEYEERIRRVLAEIVNTDDSSCIIVVMHRSALTATILDIARDNYSYPKSFYGYIQIDIASVTLVSIGSLGERKFELLCERSHSLNNYGGKENV